MSFDDVYVTLFGAQSTDDVIASVHAGNPPAQLDVEDWLHEQVAWTACEAVVTANGAQLDPFIHGVFDHFEELLGGLMEAEARWRKAHL